MENKSKWMTVLFIGSLWGFLEATLGGLLHLLPFPIAGRIMAPIGFALMFWGMKNGLKAHQLFCVSLIAASFKFFDFFLFHLPIFHISIVNPSQAIAMQGLCFAAVSSLFRKYEQSWQGTALTALPLYSVSWFLFAFNSSMVFQHKAGPSLANLSKSAEGLIVGTVLSAVVLSLSRVLLSRRGVGVEHKYSWRLQLAATSILAALAVMMRSILHS